MFEAHERAERVGWGMQTNEEIVIPASCTPSFKPGGAVKG
ncbi:HU family DNA-binding protein [Intestinimonas massiliensis (ex Afouda et al. 2020)]